MEQVRGALPRLDCEVGPCCLADEQRVAGQHELAVDDERAVLGPVPGSVNDADLDVADPQDLAVLDRIEGVLGVCDRMDRDRNAVLEREAPVARHVVGVGVRLENADDPNPCRLRRVEVLLDREGRVDDDGVAGGCVTDDVGGAPEILVDELAKEHTVTLLTGVPSGKCPEPSSRRRG